MEEDSPGGEGERERERERFSCTRPRCGSVRVCTTGPAVREPRPDTPGSPSPHAQPSAGDTHALRDGDEADADEREEAAAVPAGSSEGRQSDPSRGSKVTLPCACTPTVTH